MMAAYCRDCIERDPEDLAREFSKVLGEHNIQVTTMQ
jgi:hypothetical protein